MPISWFGTTITLTVEAAFSAATGTYGAWDAALWDTATWGPDILWQDVSQYLRSFKIDRKFGDKVSHWDPGTASVVLSNADGRFSSDNLSSPYTVAGISGIRPWRPIRIRATYAGLTYDLYNGKILDYVDTWIPGYTDAFVTLPCTDQKAALNDVDGVPGAAVGAGETSGARIHRLLNEANYTGLRNVMPGRQTMQSTTLASNVGAEIDLTVDSEGGSFFIDADGSTVFEDQYALLEQARSNTIQATFGDGSGPELPCNDITPVNTGTRIKNIFAYTRVGGTAQVAADATSRALTEDKRASRTDLICETDAQALSLAQMDLQIYKDPKRLFSMIRVKPNGGGPNTALWPHVLGRRPRDLVRVVARPTPIGNPVITRDAYIAGIHHDVTGDDWVTVFDLWDASAYEPFFNSRWDVALWDHASWFF